MEYHISIRLQDAVNFIRSVTLLPRVCISLLALLGFGALVLEIGVAKVSLNYGSRANKGSPGNDMPRSYEMLNNLCYSFSNTAATWST